MARPFSEIAHCFSVTGISLVRIDEHLISPDIAIIRKLVSVTEHLKIQGHNARLTLNNSSRDNLVAELTLQNDQREAAQRHQLSFYASSTHSMQARMDLAGFNISSNYTVSLGTQGVNQILESMVDEFVREVVSGIQVQAF